MVIDEAKEIGKLLGFDMDKVLPYERKADGFYDSEDVFRDVIKASAGTDTNPTGTLEVEALDKISPYEQLVEQRVAQDARAHSLVRHRNLLHEFTVSASLYKLRS